MQGTINWAFFNIYYVTMAVMNLQGQNGFDVFSSLPIIVLFFLGFWSESSQIYLYYLFVNVINVSNQYMKIKMQEMATPWPDNGRQNISSNSHQLFI